MLNRRQQPHIVGREPRQLPRIVAIILRFAARDRPHLARVCHQHFMPHTLQQSTHPWRMRPAFHCDPLPFSSEMSLQGRHRRLYPPLFDNFAILVDYTVPTEPIAQIDSHCHLRLLPIR